MIGFSSPETATVVTLGEPTGHNALGEPTYTPTETTVKGAFAPAGFTELVQGQDTVITNPTFYMAPGSPVPAATDHVLVRGVEYLIDGEPQQFHNPFTGYEPGPVLRLERVTG